MSELNRMCIKMLSECDSHVVTYSSLSRGAVCQRSISKCINYYLLDDGGANSLLTRINLKNGSGVSFKRNDDRYINFISFSYQVDLFINWLSLRTQFQFTYFSLCCFYLNRRFIYPV